jgi:hypothetical protein
MPERFRNIDYSDRELLMTIWSIGGDEGATTDRIASKLGITPNGRYRIRRIAPRLAWMRRYGFLDRQGPDHEITPDTPWVLTEMGQQLMGGRLSRVTQRTLENMDPGSHLLAMRVLGQQAYVRASPEAATAIRREWDHQRARRP